MDLQRTSRLFIFALESLITRPLKFFYSGNFWYTVFPGRRVGGVRSHKPMDSDRVGRRYRSMYLYVWWDQSLGVQLGRGSIKSLC